jgi:hypothetical protein
MGYLTNSNFEGAIHSVRGWNNPHLITYMESHDEERLMYKNIQFGNAAGSYNIREVGTGLKRLEMNGAFLFTIPGPKMLWQFGELGYDFSINHCANGTINNNCRVDAKPIKWDYAADARRKAVYDVYSKLIRLRFHKFYREAFLTGTIDQNLAGAFKWLKVSSGDSSHLVVVGNFDVTATSGTVSFPKAGTWYDLLNGTSFAATGAQQTIPLQPGEYHVYTNRSLADTVAVTPPPPPGNGLLVKVYPNPVVAGFTVELMLPAAGQTQVALLNTMGQQVRILKEGVLPAGKQTINLQRKALPAAPGIYYIRVSTEAGNQFLKVGIQ